MSHREALEEINRCAGTQFDPALALKFKEMFDTFSKVILPENFE